MAAVMEVGVSMPLQGAMCSTSQVSAIPLRLRNNSGYTSSSGAILPRSWGLKLRSGASANRLAATAGRAQKNAIVGEASETTVGTSGGSDELAVAKPRYGQTHKLAFASLLSAGFAYAQSALAAVSYEDVVGSAKEAVQSIDSDSFDFEVPQLDLSALTDLFNSDPLAVLLGGGAIIAVPVILSVGLRKPEGYGAVSAKQAFEKLGDEEFGAQLLDIRVEADGTPDLKGYKKKVTRVPYKGEGEEYVAKVLKKFKDVENLTIYVLDQLDGESISVAKLLAAGGFKAAYAIRGGAEGPGGWKASELPWAVPRTFNVDLGGIKELISSSDTGNVLPAALGAAAAAGVGFAVFSEAETALQLLGSAALVQLFIKKFLFAEDRKRTIEELKTFLETKVAPQEFVEEMKELGGVLLPKSEDVEAAASNGAALIENVAAETVATVEDKTSAVATETEIVASETAAIVEDSTSTLATEASETPTPTEESQEQTSSTELPRTSRPLSPYAQYPEMKPPTSPTPSTP